MIIARTLKELEASRAVLGPLGLAPTMGALHEGHLSLLAAASAQGLRPAASIFVNPTQFGPNEDFSRYPRDEKGDLEKLEEAGCALVWMPSVDEMYPPAGATSIQMAGPALRWEGAARPGHFNGVASVVAKLLGQVRPEAAFFGEKDWQQLQVVRRMAADLHLSPRIEAVPIRREADGLAMSSRNRYLSEPERAAAPELYAALCVTARKIASGEDVTASLAAANALLEAAGMEPDYLALVEAQSLEPLSAFTRPARLIAAAKLGAVRLLDNLAVG